MYCRYFSLFLILLLAACNGSGSGSSVTGQTQVTIGLGQTVAAGALTAAGAVPNSIQSMSVTAFDAAGRILAGPVLANAPTLSVTLTLNNGNNIRFLILAFAAPNGGGAELYRGEVVSNLNGGAVNLPVKMNLSVAVTPAQLTAQRGQVVSLSGSVSGQTPPATSPLLWKSGGGVVQALDAYGSLAQWTAPTTIGTFVVDAYVNPAVNPYQDATRFGRGTITVINLPPIAVDDYVTAAGSALTSVTVLNNDRDPDNDAISLLSATQGVNGAVTVNIANGTVSYTANAGFVGNDQFSYTIRDALGAQASANVFVTVSDAQAPVVTPPVAIVVEALTASGTLANTAAIQTFLKGATAIDNVGVVSLTHNAPATFPLGVTTVLFTARDGAGNAGVASSTVTVRDTIAPTIKAPANITVAAVNAAGTPASDPYISAFLAGATANDNVAGVLPTQHNAPAQFPIGITQVTFTATDGYGNIGNAVATVTVQNKLKPRVTPPANIVVAAVNAAGTPANDPYITAFLNGATAVDGLGNPLLVSHNGQTQFPLGVTTVVFTATDAYANSGTASATITISDQTKPVVSAPANVTVAAVDAYGTPASDPYIAAFLTGATANDNVAGVLPTQHNAPAQFPIGTTTVTFTATDGYGNIGNAVATVTVQNKLKPRVTPPANIVVAAVNAAGTPANDPYITAFLNGATAVDGLGNPLPVSHNGQTQFPLGVTTVVFTATDAYANTGTASATITISDQTKPVVTAPANVTVAAVDAYGTPASDPYISAFLAGATANDNVAGVLPTQHNAPAQFPIGITQVTFTATDGYGNIGSATASVIVQNKLAPKVTAPANIVVAAVNAAGTPANDPYITAFLNGATAVDGLGNPLPVNHNGQTQFPLGVTTVVFTATDAYANSGTASATITISDQTKPVVTAPANVTVAAVDAYGAPASDPYISAFLAGATANDNVAGVLPTQHNAPTQFPIGITQVTFTATDGYGNIGSATASVTVQNKLKPRVTPPANIVVAAVNAAGTPANDPYITAFLNGATAVDGLGNPLPVSHNGQTQFPLGVTTVVFTATDAYANTGTASATITVSDQTKPVVTAPANVTVAAVDAYGTPASDPYIAAFLTGATANDNVAGVLPMQHNAPTQFPIGITQVTFTATDAYGNIGSATASVIVQNKLKPTVTPPANIVVAAVNAAGTPANDPYITAFLNGATAVDGLGNPLPVGHNGQTQFPLGVTTVVFTATDAYANTGTASATITISDQTKPVVTAPANVTVAAVDAYGTPASDPYISAFLAGAMANDNVAGVLPTQHNAPAQFPIGTTTVTFTATDGYGNVGSATASVIVQNKLAPKVTAPANIVVAAVNAAGTPANDPYITAFLNGATAVDGLGNPLPVSHNGQTQFPLGVTTVVFTATDAYANTGTASATITVSDQTKPVVTAPANVTVAAVDAYGTPASDPYISAFLAGATANDNVAGVLPTQHNAPTQFPIGITQVTFTATDGYGNIGSATASVIVQNKLKPRVTPPANIVVAAVNAAGTPANDPYITAFLNGATAVDGLGNPLPVSHNGQTQFPLGVTTVVFTATDAYANTGTASATITISDQTKPVVTAPANVTVAAVDAYGTPASDPYISAFLTGATANDNVAGVLPTQHNAPAQFPIGITQVTFTATDGYGNIGNAVATVTVQNKLKPRVTPPANIVVAAVNAAGTPANDPYITAFLNGATAVDGLGNPLPVNHNGQTQFPLGVTTVVFTATDAYANSGTASATITIVDLTPPVVTPAADVYSEASAPLTLLTLIPASVVDNVDTGLTATPNTTGPFPLGITMVQWSSRDAYGNLGTAMQRVTMVDTTAPSLNAPADVYTSTTGASVAVNLGAPTVMDLVDPKPIVTNDAPAFFPLGTTVVTWSAQDFYGNLATAQQRVVVSYSNVAPVISSPVNPYALTVAEDTYASLIVTASDANGDPLSWDVYSAALHGTVSVDAYGYVSYLGLLNYNGADHFVIRTRDPYGLSDLLNVNVNVTPVNDPPTILAPADNYTVSNNVMAHTFVPVSAFDVDGDPWSIQLLAQPFDGYAVVTGAGIDYYGATTVGTKQFRFNVVDVYGLPSSIIGQTVFVRTVGNPGNPPVIVAPVDHYTTPGAAYALNVNQDGYASFTLGVTDADPGDTASFDVYAAAINGTAIIDAYGTVIYTPKAAFAGSDAFTLRVTDSIGLVDYLTVNVSVVATIPPLLAGVNEAKAALRFNGVDQYAQIAHSMMVDSYQSVTIELWLRTSQTFVAGGNVDASIIEKWSPPQVNYPYALRLFTDTGRIAFEASDGVNTPRIFSQRSLNDGQWHHIAAVRSGSAAMTLYIDGLPEDAYAGALLGTALSALNVAASSNTSPLFLARRGDPNAPHYYQGDMDELQIWGAARTQAQIQADMYAALIGNEAGLNGYWGCNDMGGITAADGSSYGATAWLGNGSPAASPSWIPSEAFGLLISPARVTMLMDSYSTIWLDSNAANPNATAITVSTLPSQGSLWQTLNGIDPYVQITLPGTTVADPYGRVVFIPAKGQSGAPYATFGVQASDAYSTSAAAIVNVDVQIVPNVVAAYRGNNFISGTQCNTVWDRYGSPYWVQSNVTVARGCALVVDAYAVVKFDPGVQLRVLAGGTLDVYGTASQPVYFTSIKDDTVGGDANHDGAATLPAAGDWQNIYYEANSSGSFNHAEIRYAGSNPAGGGLYLLSSIAVNGATIQNSASYSLVIDGSAAPMISNSWFDRSTLEAVFLSSTSNAIVIDASNVISNAPAAYRSEQGMPLTVAATIGTAVPLIQATGRIEVGVTLASLNLTQFNAWQTQIGRPLRRVQRMYNLEEPAFLWTTEVPTMMNGGFKLMLTLEPKLNADIYATSPSRLLDIAAGVYDAAIDASINGIINNVQPSFPNADIWIRIGQEMNGDWYPWGGLLDAYGNPHNGNAPGNYIAAFQHIVQRYRNAGLGENMVKFVFSPNVWPTDNFSVFYPGDTYADYIGMAGFNFGPNTVLHPTLTWQTFNTIFAFTYNTLVTVFPYKQIIIGGTSSAESGGSKAAWVTDMATQLKNGYPAIISVFWFNVDKTNIGETNWRIDSSPASLTAVQQMYLDNQLWR